MSTPTLRSTSPAATSARGAALALLALSFASFGIGTTEFVIMGLLPDVARDLSVSIPRAGLLVTGYALGVVFGGPLLAMATARADRRKALLMLIGIFILGNALCAVAPSYGLLMAARVVTAICHATFFGLGAVVAAGIVPPEKRARAIAMMFAGLTIANVLGVPFGTALGQALGWRASFWAVVSVSQPGPVSTCSAAGTPCPGGVRTLLGPATAASAPAGSTVPGAIRIWPSTCHPSAANAPKSAKAST